MKCPLCFEEKKELIKICENHQYCELCVETSYLYFHPKCCILCMKYHCWISPFSKNIK